MIRSSTNLGRRQWPSRVALVALLGVVLVGACGNPPSPSPNLSPSPSAVVSPSSSTAASGSPFGASPTAAACTSADIGASGGPWGGAAGSRGADVMIVNRGTAACLLPAVPTIALVDQAGAVLLTTQPRAGSGPAVAPSGTATFSVLVGNWCNQAVSLPLHVRLALAADAVDIDNLVVSTTDELPPCNGPGLPASLSATDWQPN